MIPKFTRTITSFVTLTALVIGGAATADEFGERLKRLTPDFAAPPLEVLEEPGSADFAVALLGVSLVQNGQRLSGDRPEIDSKLPLKVITYWRTRVRLISHVTGSIGFWDDLALVRKTIGIRIGPVDDSPPWEVGGVYKMTNEVDMQGIARQFAGHASLVVSVRHGLSSRNQIRPRQLLDIHVSPRPWKSNVSAVEVVEAFGENSRLLAERVRLGKGARAQISVNDGWRSGSRRVAVLSSISYLAPEQGSEVCDVVLNPGSESEVTLSLVAGENTSLRNYDLRAANDVKLEKTKVFASRDSGEVGDDGDPLRLHTYMAVFDVPANIESIERIQFTCPASVVIDIE